MISEASPNKARIPRASSTARALAIVIGVVAILYFARDVFIPLTFAITLALILTPAVDWLLKLHFRRTAASLIVLTLSVAAIGAMSFVIFHQLVQVLNELPEYQENIHRKVEAMHASPNGALGRATENVKQIGKELANEQPPAPPPDSPRARRNSQSGPGQPLPVTIVASPANELQYLRDLTQPFFAPVARLGMVLIFTLFLLIEQDDLRNRIFRLAGMNRLTVMTQALDDATRRVSRYLMLLFLVNTCFGALVGIGLYFIGVPYAALWGALAAILRVVPYVGSTIAGLLPLLLSLAVFDKWLPPVLVLAMFVAIEIVTANFIEPMLYGSHTGISSLAILLTTAFWTILWGPAGLILATPLTVCLVVLGRHVPQFSFLHILLGDEPVLAPEAQVYQRLLAMDRAGTRSVVSQYLEQGTLPELYDQVIIPALTMLERDRHKQAVDAEREEFVLMDIREMLGEFGGPAPALPSGEERRIICLPAGDECDEISAAMLAQLLERSGRIALSFPSGTSIQQIVKIIAPTEDDVICISALPPFAFRNARTLNRLLRRRLPGTKIIVGAWGFTGDTDRALQRFQPWLPEKIVTSLASAMEWVTALDGQTAEIAPLQHGD